MVMLHAVPSAAAAGDGKTVDETVIAENTIADTMMFRVDRRRTRSESIGMGPFGTPRETCAEDILRSEV